MKAITCSQCGALIKGISMQKKVAVCNYCGSEMFLENFRQKVLEIPNNVADKIKTKSNWDIYLENREKIKEKFGDSPHDFYRQNSTYPLFNNLSGIFIVIIFLLIIIGIPALVIYSTDERIQTLVHSFNRKYKDFDFKSKMTYPAFLQIQKSSYPKFEYQNISDEEIEFLRKVTPEDRNVPVEIFIDKNGFVKTAKAETDIDFLKKHCETAALKLVFYPLEKGQTVKVIYSLQYR